jgi:hypothetical protein
MKQTSGAFRFGRRILLFLLSYPAGTLLGITGKKQNKIKINRKKSIEFYTMQHPQIRSGQGILEIMGPQPPASRARYSGNASTFRHYAARKGPLVFS